MTVQVVAFPQEGILRAPGRREQWAEAVSMGCHAVGGIPHFERTTDEGWASVRMAFDLAEEHGCLLDFHCDETLFSRMHPADADAAEAGIVSWTRAALPQALARDRRDPSVVLDVDPSTLPAPAEAWDLHLRTSTTSKKSEYMGYLGPTIAITQIP